jgi:hypothetical protein
MLPFLLVFGVRPPAKTAMEKVLLVFSKETKGKSSKTKSTENPSNFPLFILRTKTMNPSQTHAGNPYTEKLDKIPDMARQIARGSQT